MRGPARNLTSARAIFLWAATGQSTLRQTWDALASRLSSAELQAVRFKALVRIALQSAVRLCILTTLIFVPDVAHGRLAELAQANALDESVTSLHSAGRYKEALPLAQRALAIRERLLGSEHVDTAWALNTLALLYKEMGAYDKAMPLFRRALTLHEKLFGREHLETAFVLSNLASLYRITADFAKAEALYQRALTIRERQLGADHPQTSTALNNLALLYHGVGEYAKAERLLQRALAISEKSLGPNHRSTATSLHNLALLYDSTGDYTRAERLYRRALEIRERVLGPNHAETASTLNNLAIVYQGRGAYSEARKLLRRALVIREKVLGGEHPDTAMSLTNLGALYVILGVYDQAEPLLQRGLAIRERVLGPDHPDTAASLTSLAELYRRTGAYGKARPLLARALANYERSLGPAHVDTATALNNLVAVYMDVGARDQAERLLRRAIAVYEKAVGPEHPSIVGILSNLAALYYANSTYGAAESLLRRALAIREKALGLEDPDIAVTLNNLAEVYHKMGAVNQVEPLLRRALAIHEKALGPEHPSIAALLSNLAAFVWSQGKLQEAVALLTQGAKIQERSTQLVLRLGDEARKHAFMQTLRADTFATVSLAIASLAREPDQSRQALGLGLTTLLQRKGRLLDVMSGNLSVLREHSNSQNSELLQELLETQEKLAHLTFVGAAKLTPTEYQQQFATLRRQSEGLENSLSQRSAAFRVQQLSVTVEGVQEALPPNSALIEFLRLTPVDPTAAEPWGTARYVAYVLKRDGPPSLVDLGEATTIERKVSEFRIGLQDATPLEIARLGHELYEQLLTPLLPIVGNAEFLVLAPDGVLNLLPFAALFDGEGRALIDRYSIVYVSSGRDLLRLARGSTSRQAPIVVANPDFTGRARSDPIARSHRGSLSDGRRSRDPLGTYYQPLPGTAEEAKSLKTLLNLGDEQVLTGASATETAIKRLTGPKLLHIATHGFFLADEPILAPARLTKSLLPQETSAENPMLRSGLVLAGVSSKRRSERDDGLLTALEASSLDLVGTQLVVLSACETGLGHVSTGEGVYGLRRALVLAGAEAQLNSLWKVSDAATQELMVGYYKRLLAGSGRADALREAQQQMRQDPRRSHPFFWASFIPIGDWRPIDWHVGAQKE